MRVNCIGYMEAGTSGERRFHRRVLCNHTEERKDWHGDREMKTEG